MSGTKFNVAIVTDSAAAFPAEQIHDLGIFVARMEITIDGNTLIDGANMELATFYSKLANSESIPTTSAPKPAEYLTQILKAAETTNNVLCVTVSAKLSAANDAATVGAEMAIKQNPDLKVQVFDSGTAASSQALIVSAAARAAKAGGTLDEIEAVAAQVAEKVRLVAMLDTLRFIHRSGRVPKIAVWATSALNIKPVMEFSTGKIGAIARPRSTNKALERIRKEMERDLVGKTAHINVMHADAHEHAEELRKWAKLKFDCAELFVTPFHPFMGAHTGPGLVGASWWAE
ncbi:MAG: DegV family protein [Chloroflexi bacterium]|jgi:DegV family protein with EDD domain|nr:DegV family protein [Chloroflexota bacterium]MBT5628123.1 DegV family protein [Chloroflexota bacterium]